MTKKITVEVSKDTQKKFEIIRSKLLERGVRSAHLAAFIDKLVAKASSKDIDKFVDEQTPLEWSIKEMLKDPSRRKDLEKLVSSAKKKDVKPKPEQSKENLQ